MKVLYPVRKLVSLFAVFLLLTATSAFASEVTGTLTTGLSASVGAQGEGGVSGTVVVPPSANPAPGAFDERQSAALIAAGATSIRYTTDGSAPTCVLGTVYTAPFGITRTRTVKAISCYPQNHSSGVASFEYVLSLFDGSDESFTAVPETAGKVSLPRGAARVQLSNATLFDLSGNVAAATDGKLTVGGVVKTLAQFTSGSLSAANLGSPVTVGGRAVSIAKAVAIHSGVSGVATLLANRDFISATLSIPDGAAALSSAEWDGKITPPKAGASTGTAPSGFTVGNTVVEVGSLTEVLLFDQPVTVLLSGVTGAVGYKAAGASAWVKIDAACGGTYDAPAAPAFPSECAISNGTDTKIYTYHLTSFASLSAVSVPPSTGGTPPPPSGGGGGGGGGGLFLPQAGGKKGDANKDNKVNILDFVSLMANWGKTGSGNPADFNTDGRVDILDFVTLMANWGK